MSIGQLYDSFDMRNLGILEKADDESDEEPDVDRDDSIETQDKKAQFQKWLKKAFRPSHQHIFGDTQLNPVLYFHLTRLSPGYLGGLISGLTYT